MNSRFELGRIAGIPIFLDMFFVILLILYSYRYLASGDTQLISYGLLIAAGIAVSILLHELGHALSARLFKVETSEIEFTGYGGVCRYATSLPRPVFKRVIIFLAGPAANLALYYGCKSGAVAAAVAGKALLASLLFQLATLNYYFFLFNLLPAYPLDGGQTLDAILAKMFGGIWGQRIVGALGIIVSLYLLFLAVQSLPGTLFLLILALVLADINWKVLQSTGIGR